MVRTVFSIGVLLALFPGNATAQISPPSNEEPPSQFLSQKPVRRLALVFGAQNYEFVERVPNALNDAEEVKKALTLAGFSYIRVVQDPRDDDIYDYVDELARNSGSDDEPVVIVFFFAGHGFQNSAFNYIVPVNARNLRKDSVPVTTLLTSLVTHRAGVAIFFFDSCRTGLPMSSSESTGDAFYIGEVGFSALPVQRGAILGLATEFGASALSAAHDGDADSPYTKGLIRYIPQAALSLDTALDKVQGFVDKLTSHRQLPIEVKGANGSGFFFVPAQIQLDDESERWRAVIQSNRADCAQLYINSHPGSRYLKAALDWIADGLRRDSPPSGDTCPDE